MKHLLAKTLGGFLALCIIMALAIFLPAGTINFWQGWLYLAEFLISAGLITFWLWKNDPQLLEKRVKAGPAAEKEPSQKIIQSFTGLGFLALLIIPGISFRFHRALVPVPVSLFGEILVVFGFFTVFLVFRQNSFTSATIEIAKDQKVISAGLYSLVRHPMYAGSFWLLLGTPLALGSYWGLLAIVFMGPFLIWRLLDEEKFLLKNLQGYREYCRKVRYRLIPFLW